MNAPYPPPSASVSHSNFGTNPGGLPPQRSKNRLLWVVGGCVLALAAVICSGAIGVAAGVHLSNQAAPSSSTLTPESAATAEEVRTSTVDLCTRFAAAYAAMPTPQDSGFDIIPTVNYISDALRDNAKADKTIRSAMTDSLQLMREQAAALSKEKPAGAVQPPPLPWSAAAGNAADKRVWELCQGYGG